MKSKTATSKKTASKISAKKRRKKIYVNDVTWYYEDDPADKRMTIEMVEFLKNLDLSILLERDREAKVQSQRSV